MTSRKIFALSGLCLGLLFAAVLWLGRGAEEAGSVAAPQLAAAAAPATSVVPPVNAEVAKVEAAAPPALPAGMNAEDMNRLNAEQRRHALTEFMKVADSSIARLEGDIAQARKSGGADTAGQEEKLRKMRELRQLALSRNTDITPDTAVR